MMVRLSRHGPRSEQVDHRAAGLGNHDAAGKADPLPVGLTGGPDGVEGQLAGAYRLGRLGKLDLLAIMSRRS
jgi:hypothetical protein